MEKYLMMSDVFKSELFIDSDCDDVIVDGLSLTVLESFSGSDTAKFALHAINSHDELVAMNKELLAALERVVSDITALSENSYGVHGLHRNGDLAPWSSLFSGGFFEGWLLSVDEAGDVIAKAKAAS